MGSKSSRPQPIHFEDPKEKFRSFPGSAILEKTFCGSIDTTDPAEYQGQSFTNRLLRKADVMCVSSPLSAASTTELSDESTNDSASEPGARNGGKMLARALVSEVTNNPKTLPAAELAARERQLLKAMAAGQKHSKGVGAPGVGVGPPQVLNSLAYAVTGREEVGCLAPTSQSRDIALHEVLVEAGGTTVPVTCADIGDVLHKENPHALTVALVLSRRNEGTGHDETISRQTAFDLDALQDRDYKYVSATDSLGWRAGGGEPVGGDKMAHTDTVHIPLLHMNCADAAAVDNVIHALASGDIFIPHMSVLPDSLAVHGSPLPDICLCWPCERNEDTDVEEWTNWSLEFVHNQLYEYFYGTSAQPQWSPRPFSMTLAKSVRWKTVKHMNQYFRQAEHVLESWRHKGPKTLDPEHSYMDGGASPEEVAKPHGLYLMRRNPTTGLLQPTNYFPPNFDPPYTTKMTRSLLENVLAKSWDAKRRDWSSQAQPRLVSPGMLLAAACGCADTTTGGFVATEVTNNSVNGSRSASLEEPPIVIVRSAKDETSSASSSAGEEKKMDDTESFAQPSVKSENVSEASKSYKSKNNRLSLSAPSVATTDGHNSIAASAYNSVANSGTTVMHTNVARLQKKKSNPEAARVTSHMKRFLTDDDWESTPSVPSRGETTSTSDPPGEKVSPTQWSIRTPAVTRRFPGSEKVAQKPFPSVSATKTSMRYRMQPTIAQNRTPTVAVPPSESEVSLEYSADGSSLLNQGESLLGQHFASEELTMTSIASPDHTKRTFSTVDDEQSAAAMSYQTSSSSTCASVVPSDEELFAVGWAKAMDPKSGNYYYFTLDRKKIVWDSPLSTQPVDAPGV